MSDPKTVNTIEVTKDGSIWIDIIELKRGSSQILVKQAYLCQGHRDDPTEFFISKYDIRSIIEALEKVEKEIQ